MGATQYPEPKTSSMFNAATLDEPKFRQLWEICQSNHSQSNSVKSVIFPVSGAICWLTDVPIIALVANVVVALLASLKHPPAPTAERLLAIPAGLVSTFRALAYNILLGQFESRSRPCQLSLCGASAQPCQLFCFSCGSGVVLISPGSCGPSRALSSEGDIPLRRTPQG